MERARLSSLLVIALLQLSQTEISNTLPESWYAANVINDGAYTPKPLSEIFSTQATFSSTNPIVVLSTSQNTPTSTFSTTTDRISTWTSQSPASEVVPLSTEPSPRPVIPISTTVSTTPTTVTTIISTQPSTEPSQAPTLATFQQPPAPPSPPPVVSTPQQIQINTAPQGSPPPQIQNQPQNIPPNYFLVYQAPQPVQTNPTTISTSLPPSSTLPPSSSLPPSSTLTSVVTSTSTLSTPMSTVAPQNVTAASTNPPCNTTRSQFPSFRIRMVAPAGSVTNVLFNPQAPTTTTRRPTTTRTRRRNRNNYDGCVNGCGGTRVPICASPLGVRPVDPDSLKGFPSVCHMACHNSFRRNLYEKVMDGKCGRLRNRIQPVNSNNKLKRDELNKASYTVVQGGPTVIELSRVDA